MRGNLTPNTTNALDVNQFGSINGGGAKHHNLDTAPQTSLSNTDSEVRVRPRPQIPPKPQIDVIRYSMANVQESGECELDTLLDELSALQLQLDSSTSDQLLIGLPTLNVSDSKSINQQSSPLPNYTPPLARYANSKRVVPSSLSDEFIRPVASSSICPSPDHDSAFGDASSTESRNRCRNSGISSSDSCRGSLNTPSPTQQVSPNQSTSIGNPNNFVQQQQQPQPQPQPQQPKTESEIKAAKIRDALLRMREADIKKVVIKFYIDDGSTTLSLLVDERWTVAEVMKQIAEKLRIQLTINHSIVEEYPELLIRRIYEDHEYLVENILMWTQNSQNRLYFVRRPDKFAFIDRPEEFLLSERNIDLIPSGQPVSAETKQLIVKEFFESDNVQPPEISGWLQLKSDGKKSWKQYFFVLRSSGLYYCPKGKSRNSKDLQCLMNMQTNQIYTCTDWRKKYKAPTNFGFAIKHPKIQVKASKFIKYVCAENALSYYKWMVALRIAKNGKKLYDNYMEMQKNLHSTLNQPVKVGIPQVSNSFDGISSFSTPRTSVHDTVSLLNINRDIKSPSISRMSLVSSNSDRVMPAQNSIVFDQCDDIMTGTIKKAPCEIMSHSRRETSQTERTSSLGTSSSSVRSTTDGICDNDSDEEQFPPPPPTAYSALGAHHEVEQAGYQISSPESASDISSVQYGDLGRETLNNNSFFSPSEITPNTKSYSNSDTVRNSLLNQQTSGVLRNNTPRKAPPPPPKRSETTRLRSMAAEALQNELQLATARRKKQIEQH
uniref:Ras-associating domain-containing protein n=1 Tax=Syphacia muris TaxID=451379 RepID=A0A158R5D3_9BILA